MSGSEEKFIQIDATEAADVREKGSGAAITLFFLLGIITSMLVGWVVFPKLLYSQKEQPFSFNHVVHQAEVEEGCQSCHFFRTDGSFSGIPRLDACLECHSEILGQSEEEAYFYKEHVQKNREVPWLVYSRQPDCVFFSHAAHVMGGKMDCVTCHGHIGESEESPIYEENRITGYSRNIWGRNIAGMKKNTWDRMKMDDCAACHKEAQVKQTSVQTRKGGCFKCHK